MDVFWRVCTRTERVAADKLSAQQAADVSNCTNLNCENKQFKYAK